MLKNYIVSKYISGTKKEDIELSVTQLKDRGLYEISNPLDFLAEDIYVCLENYISPKYGIDDIRQMLSNDGRYVLETYHWDDEDDNTSVVFVVNTQSQKYYYDVKCGFTSRQIYTVKQIEENDVVYLVTEHLINPSPGCKLIERCYKPYFEDLETAERYQEVRMKHFSCENGNDNSGYRISVVSKSEIEASEWYQMNLKAIEQIKSYGLDVEDYRYIESIEDVLKAIKADSYDDLSIEEQADINFEIFQSLYDYIPIEYRIFLEEDVNDAAVDEYEEIADTAIKLALVNAKSQEEFDKIYEILGPNEYRIGALTDDIYNDNKGKGYIVMSSDGDMGWYKECYFINEWPGARNSDFYGKFMKNENDTLLCLREYHPELIASRLPRQKDMQEYESRYLAEKAKEREHHYEMEFDVDDNLEPIVIGTWYPDGLSSNNCFENIEFYRDYNSHTFSIEECKKLLSGEEIVIENFKTKSDSVITIKGKLKDCASVLADEVDIRFVRTDIDPSKRRSLNSALGIDEPGLPSVGDSSPF